MSEKPNIILINCDDLGYGDLACYGSSRNNTPNLDRLAAEGKRFTDFYMASAVCSPSRGAMMTGCYPPRIGFGSFNGKIVLFPGDDIGLNASETTVATQLQSAGYATKIIGKWHCGDQPEFLPTRHGFDEYFGIPYSNDMGRQSNRPDCPPLPLLRNETVIQAQPDQRGITERYTDEALQFINKNQTRPFFLYLAHMYVHVPLFVPQQFLERSNNGAYGGAVECIDWSMGILMDQLEQLGLSDNTLIVFTSDNGSRARDEGGSNQPCRGTKATTWEGGQRVPCVMRWPNKIASGTVSEALVTSMDFFPTFSKLAGESVSTERIIDGNDISGLMFDETNSMGNDVFHYYAQNTLEAIRVGDWKLHFRKGDTEIFELYNLRNDVSETTNCYNEEVEIVVALSAKAKAIREDIGDEALGVVGRNNRPIGRIENAKPLTEYRKDHPYMIAMYDLPDMPTMSG
ncbi:MAG: sulfatase [Opitutales bacterium]|nr:sulfatase [Opitutales bacterium]MBT5815718.1 sulfatase [Opitutales bacterium]MBT6770379.1 sulfatase [Opitutales bacterium]MDG2255274.1 sulfatase [Opitutaceae bacterium]